MNRNLFVNALLIDGNGGSPLPQAAMLVEDARITAVGKTSDFTSPDSDIQIHDCLGQVLMSGLINCHAHFFMEPYTWDRNQINEQPPSRLGLEIQRNMQKALHSGVTFCRDLGGIGHLDIAFRDYVEEGLVPGPHYIAAGMPLTITGGHCWQFSRQCDGPTDFVKGVREQVRAGADFIKIMPTGGYARPKMRVNHSIMADTFFMTAEEIAAATGEAHKLGKTVAAHCNGFMGVYHAVHQGVDSIEHGQFSDPGRPEIEPLIEEMVKRGTWLVPTLSAFFKEYVRAEVEQNYQPIIESFRLCHQAGVKIAMGNDAGVPWVGHDKAAMELEHMALYGMTNMEAIIAATSDAARMLGIDQDYGTLEAGKYADFLLLDADPLADITALQHHITQVYQWGTAVRR